MSEINVFDLIKRQNFDALVSAVENQPRITQARGEFGTTILHQAAEVAPLETVKRLNELGCDIHALDNYNETPIWWAMDNSNYTVADYLLEQGASLDVMNKDGILLLHQMAIDNGLNDIDFLLSRGAPLHQKTSYGWTIFHFAAMNADLELIHFLIKQGANINAKDDNGLAPLHVAATPLIMSHHVPKYLKTIELLIESGADIFDRTNEGKTAEEMSYRHEISQLLAHYRTSASP